MNERREDTAIALDHVVKAFGSGRAVVLSDMTFSVGVGELLVLVGPSGSGKSTTLHLVAALARPDSGSIHVLGTDVTHSRHLDHHRREVVGMIFQLHDLLPHLGVRQNLEIVMMGTHRRRSERRDEAGRLLERLGLGDHVDAMPLELSGGECQRVAVARAFVNHPPVVLADEPTGSLDDASAARVIDLLREHCTGGGSVLAVSHDPRLIRTADRVVRVESGVATEVG